MAGYVGRQEAAIARAAADESSLIPADFDYRGVAALSLEARDKLSRLRPRTLGAAGRVPGITPADLAVLSVVLHRRVDARTPVAAG
jgi:tRNA uridine 5-carboxymethylaminomethyl modification enzyme